MKIYNITMYILINLFISEPCAIHGKINYKMMSKFIIKGIFKNINIA